MTEAQIKRFRREISKCLTAELMSVLDQPDDVWRALNGVDRAVLLELDAELASMREIDEPVVEVVEIRRSRRARRSFHPESLRV